MGDRRAEDIRRIVDFKITKGVLDAPADRDTIAGKRAIAFETGSRLGIPGQTLAPTDTDGITADGQENEFDDTFFNVGDSSFSADSVLDGDLKIGDELRELQAEDCVSGDDLDIRTDGEIPPPPPTFANDGTALTSRWTDPEVPPEKLGFFLGRHWRAENPNTTAPAGFIFQTYFDAMNAHVAAHVADDPGTFTGASAVDSVVATSTAYGINVILGLVGGGDGLQTFSGTSVVCTLDVDAACPSVPPVEEAFPLDNKTTLSLVDGKYTASGFETETPTEYSGGGTSIIDFCTAGGRFGRMEPTSDGGFMISERVSKGGALKGGAQYMVFDSDRKLTGSVNSDAAETLRPKDPTPVV